MTPEDKAALRASLGGVPKTQLKRVFALVRAHDDRTLMRALAAPKKTGRRQADPLPRDLARIMQPLLAPSSEKAALLLAHMAEARPPHSSAAPKGLADAARKLRNRYSDAQIRAGAKELLSKLAQRHSRRETVA